MNNQLRKKSKTSKQFQQKIWLNEYTISTLRCLIKTYDIQMNFQDWFWNFCGLFQNKSTINSYHSHFTPITCYYNFTRFKNRNLLIQFSHNLKRHEAEFIVDLPLRSPRKPLWSFCIMKFNSRKKKVIETNRNDCFAVSFPWRTEKIKN